jgi:tRNA 2-thiouridine synthesizing protein A
MADEYELDCLGKKCPRPIIEIAKMARKVPPGSVLKVQADDLAFESDVRAWVERANAEILGLENDGDTISVRIQLAE